MTRKPHEWTKVTSLASKHEADLLAGRLKAAGIRTRITKATDDPAGWLKAYGGSFGGSFGVHVPAAKAGAARAILAETGSSRPRSGGDRQAHRGVLV